MLPSDAAGLHTNLNIIKNEPWRKDALWENTRLLRTGLKEIGYDIVDGAQIISMFYYERKGLFNKYGIRVKMDMTRSRYSVYKNAVELVKENANVKYVYCDINCRLKIKFADNSEKFFGTIDELNELIA